MQKKQLVEAIIIADAAPNIIDIEEHIKQRLKLAVPKNKLEPFSESILGWWYKQVARQLLIKSIEQSKAQAIKWIDLTNIIDEMRTHFQRDSLPVTFPIAEPDEDFYAAQEGRIFVRQIRCLDVAPEQIRLSIKKFYRAFMQRTEWASEDLLFTDEISNYDYELRERWMEYVVKLKRKDKYYGKLGDDKICADFGRKVLNWVEELISPFESRCQLRMNM